MHRFAFCFAFLFSLPSLGEHMDRPENSSNVQFVLYYQPLFALPEKDSQFYINEIRKIISENTENSVEEFLVESEASKNCQEKKLRSCSKALYLTKRCIPEKEKASQYCFKKAKKVSKGFFNEAVFNRVHWNVFAVKLNYFCNKKGGKICEPLAILHKSYMNSYQKQLATRKKEK